MEWLVPVASAVIAALVALLARLLDRRRGVPSEVDAAIDSHVRAVIATLELRVKQLEASEADCKKQLADEQVRGDRLERQVNRLLQQQATP